MKIAVDFDGTLVKHAFPAVGSLAPHDPIGWLQKWRAEGAQLMLWTMRSDDSLQAAVEFIRNQGFEFDAVNEGIGDREWTTSPKIYANIYVDDAAFGCPLLKVKPGVGRELVVDWSVAGPWVLHTLKVANGTATGPPPRFKKVKLPKDPSRVARGKARAATLTPERRSEIARKASKARWDNTVEVTE